MVLRLGVLELRKILDDIKLLYKKLNSLGPDMLNFDINAEEFIRIYVNITIKILCKSINESIYTIRYW